MHQIGIWTPPQTKGVVLSHRFKTTQSGELRQRERETHRKRERETDKKRQRERERERETERKRDRDTDGRADAHKHRNPVKPLRSTRTARSFQMLDKREDIRFVSFCEGYLLMVGLKERPQDNKTTLEPPEKLLPPLELSFLILELISLAFYLLSVAFCEALQTVTNF